MSSSYSYRPRFVDIRIRPPTRDAKPEERTCDWASCAAPGVCRAPMGVDKLNQYYHFCPSHAGEYNRNWNFFADMTPEQAAAYQAGAATGHRPTWSSQERVRGRAAATKMGRGFTYAFRDAFNVFGDPAEQTAAARPRRLGRLEQRALETLGLDADASAEAIREAYKSLVKRFHPDTNGGDRTTEGRLQQVIRAYQTLKKAGYG